MTTPAGWYPDPSGAPGQRYFDGQELDLLAMCLVAQQRTDAPASAAPSPWDQLEAANRGARRHIGHRHHQFDRFRRREGHQHVFHPVDTNEQRRTIGDRRTHGADHLRLLAVAAPGSAVRDGKFEFVVTSIDNSKIGGDPTNQFMQETAQGVYVNIHLRVTNIGNEAQTFFAGNQKLHAGSQEFDPDTSGCDMERLIECRDKPWQQHRRGGVVRRSDC